jgi:hypothetical protein
MRFKDQTIIPGLLFILLALALRMGPMALADAQSPEIKAFLAEKEECDPAYPDEDVCIPSPPPDLDCSEIEYQDFTVKEPDPHRFDRDNDGIGCESSG